MPPSVVSMSKSSMAEGSKLTLPTPGVLAAVAEGEATAVVGVGVVVTQVEVAEDIKEVDMAVKEEDMAAKVVVVVDMVAAAVTQVVVTNKAMAATTSYMLINTSSCLPIIFSPLFSVMSFPLFTSRAENSFQPQVPYSHSLLSALVVFVPWLTFSSLGPNHKPTCTTTDTHSFLHILPVALTCI